MENIVKYKCHCTDRAAFPEGKKTRQECVAKQRDCCIGSVMEQIVLPTKYANGLWREPTPNASLGKTNLFVFFSSFYFDTQNMQSLVIRDPLGETKNRNF